MPAEYKHKLHLDGISGFVMRVWDDKKHITVAGWCDNHWKWNKGDRFLLINKDGSETRYLATDILHCGNPDDQYFMDMIHDPRKAKSNS